jgi:hypothetical protein
MGPAALLPSLVESELAVAGEAWIGCVVLTNGDFVNFNLDGPVGSPLFRVGQSRRGICQPDTLRGAGSGDTPRQRSHPFVEIGDGSSIPAKAMHHV